MSASDDSSLARGLEQWALARTGSRLLARALALAATAERLGHACARLADGEHAYSAADLAALAAQAWVGDGQRLTPCVLTQRGEFFFWRNWQHEQRIANALGARVQAAESSDPAALRADLEQLFAGTDSMRTAGQRQAVAAACGKRLLVLSGGPGTGKTTTVLRLLLMLQRHSTRDRRRPCVIALAAPTGKAAQRLAQALREGKEHLLRTLPATDTRTPAWSAAIANIPDSAATLHRLLEYRPAEDRYARGPELPLGADIVVVDEASMVDLALMRALLDALAASATLILLGDPDQLVSVSAGSVLADIVAAAQSVPRTLVLPKALPSAKPQQLSLFEPAQPPLAPSAAAAPTLADHCCELTHVWRAEGGLAEIYAAVRRGDGARLAALLPDTGSNANRWRRSDDPRSLAQHLQRWLARPETGELLQRCAQPGYAPAAALADLRRLQLLTALREGPFGAADLNAEIDARLRQHCGGALWYPGRPVLVRHNDYVRRLFNGDIGLALGSGNDLRVYFETTDSTGVRSLRALSPRELPEHDLAYAITVHKSQGSEYGHVAVILPPQADNPVLSRQLLYTAVSRAKSSVEIWSSAASLAAALQRVSVRAGGLRGRLLGNSTT